MKVIENKLYLGEFRAKELAELYGTPLYVYEEEVIKKNLEASLCMNGVFASKPS